MDGGSINALVMRREGVLIKINMINTMKIKGKLQAIKVLLTLCK
nr:MAG TPA_asm: hypothetical protein [Caudoviricetes sp.]